MKRTENHVPGPFMSENRNMIYYPDYYVKFRCDANKCPDTCCAYWEICIDDETCRYYGSVTGVFGDRLRSDMTYNEDNEPVFRLRDKRCPFLNKDNLCDIHIELGEEHTCEVCREHPRFTEIYDGFTEKSLSISCPAANRLIFEGLLTQNTYPAPVYTGEDMLLHGLLRTRKLFLDRLSGGQNAVDMLPFFSQSIKSLADELYEYDDSYEAYYDFDGELLSDFEGYLLEKSELLTTEWSRLLTECTGKILPHKAFSEFCLLHKDEVNKAFAYLIFRYFLKAVNDEEIELNNAFITVSLFTCIDISVKTNLSFTEVVRLFSKEIEHDLCNIETIKGYIKG